MDIPTCPLCHLKASRKLFELGERFFFECPYCDLLFAFPDCLLSKEQEHFRYEQHNNDAADPGYINHLNRLKVALEKKLTLEMRGLDYGCGPTTVLANLFEHSGFAMESYDPFFFPSTNLKPKSFDFVTCSEVAEHFHYPNKEFGILRSLLRPKGWIAIMTNLRDESKRNPQWWYLKDPTHRCFYSERTFEIIADIFGLNLYSLEDNVVLLQVLE